jgi:hypothetical protein
VALHSPRPAPSPAPLLGYLLWGALIEAVLCDGLCSMRGAVVKGCMSAGAEDGSDQHECRVRPLSCMQHSHPLPRTLRTCSGVALTTSVKAAGKVSNAFRQRSLTALRLLLLLLLVLLAVLSAWLEIPSPLTASKASPFSCMIPKGTWHCHTKSPPGTGMSTASMSVVWCWKDARTSTPDECQGSALASSGALGGNAAERGADARLWRPTSPAHLCCWVLLAAPTTWCAAWENPRAA